MPCRGATDFTGCGCAIERIVLQAATAAVPGTVSCAVRGPQTLRAASVVGSGPAAMALSRARQRLAQWPSTVPPRTMACRRTFRMWAEAPPWPWLRCDSNASTRQSVPKRQRKRRPHNGAPSAQERVRYTAPSAVNSNESIANEDKDHRKPRAAQALHADSVRVCRGASPS